MQNTFSQSGNDSKCFFKKIIFQNRYVALETPKDPPPFMAKSILNFHFDYLTPSLKILGKKGARVISVIGVIDVIDVIDVICVICVAYINCCTWCYRRD